jgi:Fe-S-cluster-containing dehydrogenase component
MSGKKRRLDQEDDEQSNVGGRTGSSFQISRRKFLSMSALAGCAAAGFPASAYSTPEFRGWPESYGMLTDITACVGCRSCEKACNKANEMPAPDKPFEDGTVFKERRWPSAKTLTVVNRYENPDNPFVPVYRKIQCNHCMEPACATACPIHAYTKTPEGAVTYNPDLCFGCRYCVIACPFNMPGYDYESALEPRIVKCILCHGRIIEGQLPACAEACPGGALTFGRRNDIVKLARKRIMDSPQKYIDHIYGEHEAGGTAWLYISGVPFKQLGFPDNLPRKPMIELTRGYLSSVPVIFTTFPALFGMIYALTKNRDKTPLKEDDLKHTSGGEK